MFQVACRVQRPAVKSVQMCGGVRKTGPGSPEAGADPAERGMSVCVPGQRLTPPRINTTANSWGRWAHTATFSHSRPYTYTRCNVHTCTQTFTYASFSERRPTVALRHLLSFVFMARKSTEAFVKKLWFNREGLGVFLKALSSSSSL